MSNRGQTKDKLKFHHTSDFKNILRRTEASLNKKAKFGTDRKIPIAYELNKCECGNQTMKRVCERCGLVLRE